MDLNDDGIEITELSQSTIYVDAGGDGLMHRTAWADSGDGVLYYDPDGLNEIAERRQYIFTEWDPTATSDIEALATIFDSNSDGVLDASDDEFANFKLMVTNDDGSTTSKTLTELGIASIDLTADTTHIELADGSVITGQTTFTRSDGTTGTVGDMLLAAEAQGHRVEEIESTDGSGNRVVDITAYAADGLIEYSINSVTSPDGEQITNRYDDNGDGVTDRIQTINTVTQPDGSTVETETNLRGSDALTAVVQNITVTTVSANGLVETIERDRTGGGWFDQKEVRTTLADGSRTIDVDYLAQDGSVINGIGETVSIDGLNRVEAFDEDGDGTADLAVVHDITINADDSRTESLSATNEDASLRYRVTEDVSADGRTKTIERDLDGDGDTDTREDLVIIVNADDTTTSTLTVKNGDGSTRGTVTTDQSADALTKTTETDQDGDGDIDLKVVDATVINGDGSRENTVTQTNNDGSVRDMRKVTLGADKVTTETWVDLNQNGVFEATDLVGSVVVDAVTQERTATDLVRNPDGTISASISAVTSADGLNRQVSIDADGDGNTDTSIDKDTSVDGAGIATTIIDVRNQDGTLRNSSTATTSADGLTVTTHTDIDGDGAFDGKLVDANVLEADDSTTRTVSGYAGNGTTLLSELVMTESADRRTTTVNLDADGDGVDDSITVSVEATDGARTTTSTSYNADSSAIGQTVDTVSANGLEMTSETDFDGDLIADVKVETTTVFNA
ncbi:MAG: hemolysin, partial [Hyphomicrobiales bacterium]|nr:hemolysin [Hyphomicrobiales bacterium]